MSESVPKSNLRFWQPVLNCLNMTTQVTRVVNKVIKVRKRLSKVKSHIKYLDDCKINKVIPRSLNLAILTKSGELWKGNKRIIFNILNKHKIFRGRKIPLSF